MKASHILQSIAVFLIAISYCGAQPVKALLPDYASLQYAGSSGWLSVGTGYHLFKDHFRAGLQYGFVPKQAGGELHILSAVLFYKPLKVRLSDKVSINPIDFGMKAAYQFGEKYYFKWPEKYPDHYYWWNSALRLHLVTESSLTMKLDKSSAFKSITGFIEFNSSDLYMISYIQNMKSLKLAEIVKTGIGVRINF